MNTVMRWCRNELSGWQRWEIIYVTVCTALITGIAIYLGDTGLGIFSAVTGTLYTMFAGKGRISCYFFGIFNTITYGYIARSQTLYGDMMLNWFIYLPMMFAGIIMWHRQRKSDGSVIKTGLSGIDRLVWVIIIGAGTVIYSEILAMMGDNQPLLDAATTVISVSAMILTLKRCIEQWLLWTLVNGLSVVMWLQVFRADGNSIATLLWWIIMLVTGMIFFIQWYREIRAQENPEQQ